MMSDNLATVFNDGDVEETAVVEETPQAEPEAEPETGEKEKDSTPEPEAEKEPQSVPISALMAERDKRQTLQRQVDDLTAKKASEPAPDVFDNQQGFRDHITQEMQTAMFNERANISEYHARREFKDLDQTIEKYQSLKDANPALVTQVQNAASPYHEIVDIVSKHERMEKMQNIDEFEAKTRSEIEIQVRAEMKAELEGKVKADKDLRESIPTSLVDEPSKGSINKPEWAGPTPLNGIFGD